MTDRQSFEKLSGSEELWNVTLLPVPARRETKPLENLDVRGSDAEIVTLLASFESQRRAVGW